MFKTAISLIKKINQAKPHLIPENIYNAIIGDDQNPSNSEHQDEQSNLIVKSNCYRVLLGHIKASGTKGSFFLIIKTTLPVVIL